MFFETTGIFFTKTPDHKDTFTIMETSKASNPWPKALNKHNTHNVHQDRECYLQVNKQLTYDVHINKGLNVTKFKMHTHTYAYYTD